MRSAALVAAMLLTGCGSLNAGSGVAPANADAVARATASPAPSPTPTVVALPDELSLVAGTPDGKVYPQVVRGKPAGAPLQACAGPVRQVVSDGRRLIVMCGDPAPGTTYVDLDTGTVSPLPGVRALEAAFVPSVDGRSYLVYTEIGACPAPAAICKTKLVRRDLGTGATLTIDEQYGVGVDMRLTLEGITVWRPINNSSFVRSAGEAGTWVLRGTTLTRLFEHRLIDGGKGRHLLESEQSGQGMGCCTYVLWRTQQEQRLTPASVRDERGIAMLEDGRMVAFRPGGAFDGTMVVYRGPVPERLDYGTFARYRVLRVGDWLLGPDYSAGSNTTLTGYRISDGAFAPVTTLIGVSALAVLGPKKPLP